MRKYKVLLVEDEEPLRNVARDFLHPRKCEVLETGTCAGALRLAHANHPDAVVLDHSLPDGTALDLIPKLKMISPAMPIIVVTGHGSIDIAVAALKLGAQEFLTKPVELEALFLMIQRSVDGDRGHSKHAPGIPNPFVGQSPVIRKLEETARKVLASESPILILGETGTGKGVLARWLHQTGSRATGPFVDLNCGALSRDLLETELFGHERGAFTGAVQRKTGLFEVAHHGTVFLDEIGDVDLSVQPKLLKVLEEKQFRRLGDVVDRQVDIRLIAATHHNLIRSVHEGTFRSDLFYRINTIPLTTPPLRHRVEDIPPLVDTILETLSDAVGEIEVAPDAMRALQSYPWPGNIRELHNMIERAVLLSGSRTLTAKDLRLDTDSEALTADLPGIKTLEEMERQYIEEVLTAEGGRVESAARTLGIPRSSLYHKIKQYGINRQAAELTH